MNTLLTIIKMLINEAYDDEMMSTIETCAVCKVQGTRYVMHPCGGCGEAYCDAHEHTHTHPDFGKPCCDCGECPK